MIHSDSLAYDYTHLGPEQRRFLHVYPGSGRRTCCGRTFLKFTKKVTWVHIEDLFQFVWGSHTFRPGDQICPACRESEEYKSREALHLLAELP